MVRAINAGADMLIMGNNINTGFEPDRPAHIIGVIVDAVRNGRIPVSRLREANRRIDTLARKLSQKR